MRKFEQMVANHLTQLGYKWAFESQVYDIKTKVRGQVCLNCGVPMYRIAKYTPDLHVKKVDYDSNGKALARDWFYTVIEVKGGSFKPTDQARYKRFVQQHPGVNYVICFRANVRLKNLRGRPTVKEWGKKVGIDVVVGLDGLKDYLK